MSKFGEHFIKEIEIKNYKLFKDFKAEGFGRVNLIGGKNNVGKTAFMEACRINIYGTNVANFIQALVKSKNTREMLNYFYEYTSNNNNSNFLERFVIRPLQNIQYVNIKSNIKETIFRPLQKNGIITYQCEIDNHKFNYNPNEDILFTKGNDNISSISTNGLSNLDIIKSYVYLQREEKESFLNKSLNIIDNAITAFKIFEDIPYCKISDEYRELTEFGDGTQQFIAIIISLFKSKKGTLFIDEIGNGIHYSVLDKFWEIILKISKEQNVQVFATTHSKECIESYARVAKNLEDEEVTFTQLKRMKDNSIKAGVYDSDTLINAIEQDHEVRGW